MPGLLNHLTGTLDEIEAMKSETEKLMKTIRMPRKMGEITERMPAPQYDQPSPAIKRTNSMPSGLEEADKSKALTEKKKPEFVRGSVNGSLNKELTSNRS